MVSAVAVLGVILGKNEIPLVDLCSSYTSAGVFNRSEIVDLLAADFDDLRGGIS